jgi:hypothetical protein
MDQDYDIKDLQFALPGISLGDPSQIEVTNEVMHYDIQADVWLLPFLNVFGLIGKVNSDTLVDLSKVEITGLPFSLGTLPVSIDGTVLHWFTAPTTGLFLPRPPILKPAPAVFSIHRLIHSRSSHVLG